MKIKVLLLTTLASVALAGEVCGRTAVGGLIDRISNGTAKNIVTKLVKVEDGATPFETGTRDRDEVKLVEVAEEVGTDFFDIRSDGKNVVISGNNESSIAAGVNWYLKYVAGIHISWNNLTQDFPDKLPLPAEPITRHTEQEVRYYLNYCTFSYTMAFWDWERWEKELDWMALHGINLSLSIIGNEVVWYNVLQKLGYSAEEIGEFISGPAYMAWWQMNNLEGWGGPNPEEWYKRQERLQKKILARMDDLGIEPVFPGFSGMVPRNIGEKLGYEVTDQGTWNAIPRPAFMQPGSAQFDEVADLYYEEMEKLYGTVSHYEMDPFHEGGSTAGIDLPQAGKTIMAAMKRANPEAVWVIQGWQANPRVELIKDLEAHDLMVLDLYSEKRPQWGDTNSMWYRPDGYMTHDWVYCMLLNFGGRVGLHGRMDALIDGFYAARTHANGGSKLRGVGVTPEGIDNNPVMYELLYELPWRDEKFTKEEWLKSYITARYGEFDQTVYEAWLLLARYPYSSPAGYPGDGSVESLFCARPSIDVDRASAWGLADLFYDSKHTREAAAKLLSVADKFADNNNFRYDLVDVLRQSIADHANDIVKEFKEAFHAGDAKRFEELAGEFLAALDSQDRLLATRTEFRLGHWLEQAKSATKNVEHRDLYEWNARMLITVWGNREASEAGLLHDYGCREWNGLLSDFYRPRWEAFFDATLREMRGQSVEPIDYFTMEEAWTRGHKAFGVEGEGDAIATAREVYDEVFGQSLWYDEPAAH